LKRFLISLLCLSSFGCATKQSSDDANLERGGVQVEGVGDYYKKKRQHFFMKIFSGGDTQQ